MQKFECYGMILPHNRKYRYSLSKSERQVKVETTKVACSRIKRMVFSPECDKRRRFYLRFDEEFDMISAESEEEKEHTSGF